MIMKDHLSSLQLSIHSSMRDSSDTGQRFTTSGVILHDNHVWNRLPDKNRQTDPCIYVGSVAES